MGRLRRGRAPPREASHRAQHSTGHHLRAPARALVFVSCLSARRFFFPQASARCCWGIGIYWRKVALSLLGCFFRLLYPFQVYSYIRKMYFSGGIVAPEPSGRPRRLELDASRRLRMSISWLCAHPLPRRRHHIVVCVECAALPLISRAKAACWQLSRLF